MSALLVERAPNRGGRRTSAQSLLSRAVTEDGHAWDAAMMRRVVAGDDTALAQIYDRYSSIVHGIARRLLGPATAPDVCQEVFVALWRHPERFDPARGSLSAYLATIAHRRCVDEMRRAGRRAANEERSLDPTRAVDDPAALGMQRVTASAVRRALAILPEVQRRAVELAYFQGLTFREVALATGVSEGTAKSRLRLARDHLAAALEPLAPLPPIRPDVTP